MQIGSSAHSTKPSSFLCVHSMSLFIAILISPYFCGVKLIFSRRKHIALIKARIKAGGAPLTRSEYRLIQTQKDDILRLEGASTAICGCVSFVLMGRGLEVILFLFSGCSGFQRLASMHYGYGASVVTWNSSQEMSSSLCNMQLHFRIENCGQLLKSVGCNASILFKLIQKANIPY